MTSKIFVSDEELQNGEILSDCYAVYTNQSDKALQLKGQNFLWKMGQGAYIIFFLNNILI